jgi:hypothetical protein
MVIGSKVLITRNHFDCVRAKGTTGTIIGFSNDEYAVRLDSCAYTGYLLSKKVNTHIFSAEELEEYNV